MQLAEVGIKNFKGLLQATFLPSRFACLVGENNAGKSSVLQAVAFALNRPPQLPTNLYYHPDQPIEFALRFTDVTAEDLRRLAEEHRTRIAEIVEADTLKLTVRYRPGEKAEVVVPKQVPREARFRAAEIDAAFAGARAPEIRNIFAETYADVAFDADLARNITGAKALLAGHIAALPAEAFEPGEGSLPSGIANSITPLVPEPIYIPAVKNFNDDMKTSQSTSFGRLLALLLEDMEPDLGQINQALNQLNTIFNRVAEGGNELDERHRCVRELENLVETLLSQNFPRARVELRIPPPELKAILSSAQIYVDDGTRDLIDNKGDGIKRSLTFALLQAYVHQLGQRRQQRGADRAAHRPIMFLFEEPELYLHPKSQTILFNTLARISETHQVVVTTHSPLFFSPGVTASFVRVAKRVTDEKPVGELFPVDVALDADKAETFRLAKFENADAAFFSRRVVLFEGESDDAYCKHVARLLNPDWDFDEKNVAMVKVSGKGNFAKFRRFFTGFGIEVKIVADLDAIFDGFQHLGGDDDARQARTEAIRVIDERIATLGVVAELSRSQIKRKVHQDSWRDRYEAAKVALRQVQATKAVTDELVTQLDELFTWEDDIARVRVCKEDTAAHAALIPVIDVLRQQGICVLSRGAIEDYYLPAAPTAGQKPERALAAAALILDRPAALTLSEPLADGRPTELEQVFEEMFRAI
ncbi:Predicted ATP-dependent endonuclease of the OLD family, contains P-loop ATPase and TOPRIM domains [Burkholderia sp. CF099]|nr:Predicted ATP-dependent endonuclease of the OLD family, contains P-loop ATPase and TOPRIM domains [Burkholderia sp. CF099]